MKMSVGRGQGFPGAPLRPLFARQDVPTGIPSNIQTDTPDAEFPEDDDGPGGVPVPGTKTDSSDADDAESAPTGDEARTRTRVVTVTKTDSGGPTVTGEAATEAPDSGGGLSGGATAGIVIGVLALLLLVLGVLFFLWRRRRQRPTAADSTDEKPPGAADPGVAQLDSAPVAEVEGSRVVREPSELAGSPLRSVPAKESI